MENRRVGAARRNPTQRHRAHQQDRCRPRHIIGENADHTEGQSRNDIGHRCQHKGPRRIERCRFRVSHGAGETEEENCISQNLQFRVRTDDKLGEQDRRPGDSADQDIKEQPHRLRLSICLAAFL